jgi:hypothetical protein
MRIKVQLAPHPRLLATRTGDTLGGLPIAYTHEGDPHTILTTPPDWTETTVEAWARALAVQGLLVDDGELWRPEKEPGILWLHGSQDADILWEFADTCPGIGVDADTRGRGRLGAGIKVAILDTGVHGAHEYWARLVAEGRLLGDLTDEVGHGTHCAGIILMIAPGIILRSWKVLPNGSGPEGLIAAGIDAAVAWGARIITMSLGGVGPSAILRGAVGRARAAGVLVASAAGNGSSAQPIGSPADASTWAVCAYNRSDPPGWASFSDGRYPTDRSLPRVIDPGLDVVSTVPGGYRANSGTSMACPHRAGIAALLLGSGLDAPAVERYVASHAGWAPDGLASPLRPDFGVVEGPLPEPPPEEADGAAAIRARTQELRDRVVAIQLDRCAWDADYEAYRASMVQICDHDAGPIHDVANQIDAALPPKVEPPPGEPPPGPPPAPRAVGCVYGTYSGHGLAVDAYAGRTPHEIAWGPHHWIELRAPADGTIVVYQLGTPLAQTAWQALAAHSGVPIDVYAANYQALWAGWRCWATPLQTMIVAVWYPSARYVLEGIGIGHLHYGHLHPAVEAGAIRAGAVFGRSWDSGIRFEPGVPRARAAHTHCCAGAGAQLSPNGDLPGRLAVLAQGWAPATDIGTVPGPPEYFRGLYTAGRLTSDFERAGQPLPPLPS